MEKAAGNDRCNEFVSIVKQYFSLHGRKLPWRDDASPYQVYVSEVMLQQTQVPRVVSKYNEFIKAYPDWNALCSAAFAQVLRLWNGLGYNRRAKFLKEAACIVVREYDGTLPNEIHSLEKLPGIGPATARSIAAFAFNKPVVFLETNIRTAYIYHFFGDTESVADSDLIPFVEKTLDRENPGGWYSALMDYGTMLKKTAGNHSRRSKAYTRQSSFKGSVRYIRGKVLRLLAAENSMKFEDLERACEDKRTGPVLKTLQEEGFLACENGVYRIKD